MLSPEGKKGLLDSSQLPAPTWQPAGDGGFTRRKAKPHCQHHKGSDIGSFWVMLLFRQNLYDRINFYCRILLKYQSMTWKIMIQWNDFLCDTSNTVWAFFFLLANPPSSQTIGDWGAGWATLFLTFRILRQSLCMCALPVCSGCAHTEQRYI